MDNQRITPKETWVPVPAGKVQTWNFDTRLWDEKQMPAHIQAQRIENGCRITRLVAEFFRYEDAELVARLVNGQANG